MYSEKYKDHVISLIMDILENEFGHHSKSGRPDLHKIPEVYQKNNGNFWIAINDDKNVIGTIALSNYGNGKGYLQRFFVKKELRRKGIGGKLLNVLLDFAKGKNYKDIFLSTWNNMSGNNFYIKSGFRRIDFLPKEIPHSSSDNVFYTLKLQ